MLLSSIFMLEWLAVCWCALKKSLINSVELLIVECTEVVEAGVGEHRRGRHHPIGEVVGHPVAHGEVVPADVENSEITVLGRRTVSIQAKTVSEVLLTVIPHETLAGKTVLVGILGSSYTSAQHILIFKVHNILILVMTIGWVILFSTTTWLDWSSLL